MKLSKEQFMQLNMLEHLLMMLNFSLKMLEKNEISFMKEMMDAVIGAGAKTINLPDTVGYRLPNELGAMIKELTAYANDRAIISVHNHNDLGLATANTLAAVFKWC